MEGAKFKVLCKNTKYTIHVKIDYMYCILAGMTTEFKSAGCIFTNGRHILAGFQDKHQNPSMNGFGGKRMDNEQPIDTALRETIEELYGYDTVPTQLIDKIKWHIHIPKPLDRGDYKAFVYSFEDLRTIQWHVKYHMHASAVYIKMPFTLEELILNRLPSPTSEVKQLALLPLLKSLTIDSYFLDDCVELLKPGSESVPE